MINTIINLEEQVCPSFKMSNYHGLWYGITEGPLEMNQFWIGSRCRWCRHNQAARQMAENIRREKRWVELARVKACEAAHRYCAQGKQLLKGITNFLKGININVHMDLGFSHQNYRPSHSTSTSAGMTCYSTIPAPTPASAIRIAPIIAPVLAARITPAAAPAPAKSIPAPSWL